MNVDNGFKVEGMGSAAMTFGGTAPTTGTYHMIIVTNPQNWFTSGGNTYNIFGTDASGNNKGPMSAWNIVPRPTGDTASQSGANNINYDIIVP